MTNTLKENLNQWFEGDLGTDYIAQEHNLLEKHIHKIFGYHLVFSGFTRSAHLTTLINQSPIKHKIVLDSVLEHANVNANISTLPLKSDSTDLYILQHGLDYEPSTFQVLREATRIVLPNGHFIIIGFNPWSILGCRGAGFRILSKSLKNKSLEAPWASKFISAYRLKEWLDVLGFDILACETSQYSVPFANRFGTRYAQTFEKLSRRIFSQFGNIYLVHAKKRVSCITPVRLNSERKRAQLFPISVQGKVSKKEPDRR